MIKIPLRFFIVFQWKLNKLDYFKRVGYKMTKNENLNTKKLYQVGGYVRLSVEDSGKNSSDSIQNQISMIEDFVKKDPQLQLYNIYCDNGKSGVDFQRPAWEKLLLDIKKGFVNCVIVKDLSRLGRNYIETGNYIEELFPFLGIRFLSICDNFDSLTSEYTTDGYLIPLKNLMNDMYAKDISQKTGTALKIKQKNGDFIGTWASYGYKKVDKNKIVIDRDTAPVVQSIFQWRLEGSSISEIIEKLQEKNIPSPSQYRCARGILHNKKFLNTPWTPSTIQYILKNQVYLGHLIQGKKRQSLYEGKSPIIIPENQWIIIPNTHESIVSQDTFDKVQNISCKIKNTYQNNLGKYDNLKKSLYLLKGLLYCDYCGAKLIRRKNIIKSSKGNKLHFTFICPTHSRFPNKCPFHSIREDILIEILMTTLENQINAFIDLQKQDKFLSHSKENKETQDAIKKNRLKLNRLIAYRKELYERLILQKISKDEYSQLNESYKIMIKDKKEKIDFFHKNSIPITNYQILLKNSIINNKFLNLIFQKILVSEKGDVTLILQYSNPFTQS